MVPSLIWPQSKCVIQPMFISLDSASEVSTSITGRLGVIGTIKCDKFKMQPVFKCL